MSTAEEFGYMLFCKRKEFVLSQEKMAERGHISVRHYHNLERGKAKASLETAVRLASAFDISLDALLKRPEE